MIKLKFLPIDSFIRDYIMPNIDQKALKEAIWILIPVAVLVFLGLLLVAGCALKKKEKVKAKIDDLKLKIMWNIVLKSLMVGYLGYATSFFTQIKQLLENLNESRCPPLHHARLLAHLHRLLLRQWVAQNEGQRRSQREWKRPPPLGNRAPNIIDVGNRQ